MVKKFELRGPGTWVWIPVLSVTSYEILNKLLNLKKHTFLKYNSYCTIQPFKVHNSIHRYVQSSPQSILEHFSCYKKKLPYLLAIIPLSSTPFSHSPKEPLIYFLSLSISLFWIYHMNGIVLYVVFCDWHLSFSVIIFRVIHVLAWMRTLFLFMVE